MCKRKKGPSDNKILQFLLFFAGRGGGGGRTFECLDTLYILDVRHALQLLSPSRRQERLRLLRTNSSKEKLFNQRLRLKGYPDNLLNMTLSEVNFSERMSTLQTTRKRFLPFVTEYRPPVPNLKHLLMNK